MSPEERELLEKSVSLAKDNNKMLHSMRNSMRLASVMRAVYWLLIIGSAIGAYYFIQPYMDQLVSVYNGAKSDLNNVGEVLKNLKK